MKFGLFLLILGLLLAGAATALWMYAEPGLYWQGSRGWHEAKSLDAIGIGVMVVGGGIALGGVIRMIIRR